jgi:hypothetical protein
MAVFSASATPASSCLANGQRRSSMLPQSPKDTARKASEHVAKMVLPGSYTQPQRALNDEARDYGFKVRRLKDAGA